MTLKGMMFGLVAAAGLVAAGAQADQKDSKDNSTAQSSQNQGSNSDPRSNGALDPKDANTHPSDQATPAGDTSNNSRPPDPTAGQVGDPNNPGGASNSGNSGGSHVQGPMNGQTTPERPR